MVIFLQGFCKHFLTVLLISLLLSLCLSYLHWVCWWGSLVAQKVKNLPAMQETWVWSLGWEDPPLKEGKATHFSILAWRIPIDREALWATVHGVPELDTAEQLRTKFIDDTLLKTFQWHCIFHKMEGDVSKFSSVTQSCVTFCDPGHCSTPGLPVHHQLPEIAQPHVHWVGDAIQLFHLSIQYASKFGKHSSGHRSEKCQFSFQL